MCRFPRGTASRSRARIFKGTSVIHDKSPFSIIVMSYMTLYFLISSSRDKEIKRISAISLAFGVIQQVHTLGGKTVVRVALIT